LNILNKLKYAFTRKAAWIFVPLFLIGSFVPPNSSAQASDGNKIVFAYQQATVSQDIDVSLPLV